MFMNSTQTLTLNFTFTNKVCAYKKTQIHTPKPTHLQQWGMKNLTVERDVKANLAKFYEPSKSGGKEEKFSLSTIIKDYYSFISRLHFYGFSLIFSLIVPYF